MTARYALYFAPAPDTPTWAFGSAVLGYDAASGTDVPGFALPGWDAGAWRAFTERPRLYGFHATMKAPFRLAGSTEDDLVAALEAFAADQAAFRLGPLSVTAITEPGASSGFVALTPKAPPPELAALERDVVTAFDQYRSPLTEDERARRRPERLSPRQLRYLDAYGYPFVMEDFRFHMTLTGPTQEAPQLADALADEMAARIGAVDIRFDALSLFRQARTDEPFRIISRCSLGRRR